MPKMLTAIDLFCGAGGLSHGFTQAGFQVLAGNDYDEVAGETFAATHPDAKFIGGPIENVTANSLLKTARIRAGQLDCLIGGPPCQGFSVYNHQRGMHDKRSVLFREYLRLVEGIRPKWVVMENVTGITSAGSGAAVDAIVTALGELGYSVEKRILRAEEYGVPQERRRVVFIGNRIGKPIIWPTPTHGEDLAPLVTIRDAISDLPAVENGIDPGDLPYAKRASSSYQREMRRGCRRVTNHSAPKLAAINLERMKFIPQGGSWRDIPFELLPKGMQRARRCDHTKRYGRLRWDGLASTILTKCDLHWGAYVHPQQDRVLTVREAARLQSFPDTFNFAGSRTQQYVQVGNAVPPLLGRIIAEAIIEASASRSAAKVYTPAIAPEQLVFEGVN